MPPAPDRPADVHLLPVDLAGVEPPARAVHQAALILPVKPLAGQLVVLVAPLGLRQGDIVQAGPVLRDKPGQLSSGAGGPAGGPGPQLWSHDETLRVAVLVPANTVVVHPEIMSQLVGNDK